MQHYDPLDAPDCEEWLALDEQERIALARDYHGSARIRLPNAGVHAAVHAIVETQSSETRRPLDARLNASWTKASTDMRLSTPSARCSSSS